MPVAVTFGGKETTAKAAIMSTKSPGILTVPPAAPATARPVTLIAGRAPSPAAVALSARTKPLLLISTAGESPGGESVRVPAPAPTGISPAGNAYGTPPASPTSSARSAIVPVRLASTPSPPNTTVCACVPRPDTDVAGAAPAAVVTLPYTGPSWTAGGPSGRP